MRAHHRVLAFLLALVLALSLGACGKKEDPNVSDIDKGGPVGPQNPPRDIGTAPGAHGGHATPGAEEPSSSEPEKAPESAPEPEPEPEPEPKKPSFDYTAKPTTLGEITGYVDYVERRMVELNDAKAKANKARLDARAKKLNIRPDGSMAGYKSADIKRIYAEIGDKDANIANGQVMGYSQYAQAYIGNLSKYVYGWDYMSADDQCDLIRAWIDPENEDHEWFMIHAYYQRYCMGLSRIKRESEFDYSLNKDGDATVIPEFSVSEEDILAAWSEAADTKDWKPVANAFKALEKAAS